MNPYRRNKKVQNTFPNASFKKRIIWTLMGRTLWFSSSTLRKVIRYMLSHWSLPVKVLAIIGAVILLQSAGSALQESILIQQKLIKEADVDVQIDAHIADIFRHESCQRLNVDGKGPIDFVSYRPFDHTTKCAYPDGKMEEIFCKNCDAADDILHSDVVRRCMLTNDEMHCRNVSP